MGANLSTSQTENVRDIVNNSTRKIIDSEAHRLETSVVNNQNIDFIGQDMVIGQNCNIQQHDASKIMVLSQVLQKSDSTLSRSITNDLMSEVDKRVNLTNSGLNFAQWNASVDRNTMRTKLKTITKDMLQKATSDSIRVNDDSSQNITFHMTGTITCDGNMSQNHHADEVIKSIQSQLSAAVLEDVELARIADKYSLSASLTNKGIDPTSVIMAIVALIVVLIIGRQMMKK